MSLQIHTTAFEEGENIPIEYTCEGKNISPHIIWSDPPDETESFAMIMEDPDAPGGTFTHWIIFNIPSTANELKKGVPEQKVLDNGAVQSKNDFGNYGYGGPCPPKGDAHRYFFRFYALRKKLSPDSITNGHRFYEAINGLIMENKDFMGKYKI